MSEVHESVLDKQLVLKLNASWIAVEYGTPRKAVVSLMGGDGEHPVVALDISFNEDGTLEYANPVEWEEWITLPIRPQDFYIQTHKGRIRVPTVIIAKNFKKVPTRKARVSSASIFERDGGKCQYTGKLLTRSSSTLDHVLPRSRGGKDTFQNLVLCDAAINRMKADRTPEEAGLTLLRKPVAPPELPVSATIRQAFHRDWEPFLLK